VCSLYYIYRLNDTGAGQKLQPAGQNSTIPSDFKTWLFCDDWYDDHHSQPAVIASKKKKLKLLKKSQSRSYVIPTRPGSSTTATAATTTTGPGVGRRTRRTGIKRSTSASVVSEGGETTTHMGGGAGETPAEGRGEEEATQAEESSSGDVKVMDQHDRIELMRSDSKAERGGGDKGKSKSKSKSKSQRRGDVRGSDIGGDIFSALDSASQVSATSSTEAAGDEHGALNQSLGDKHGNNLGHDGGAAAGGRGDGGRTSVERNEDDDDDDDDDLLMTEHDDQVDLEGESHFDSRGRVGSFHDSVSDVGGAGGEGGGGGGGGGQQQQGSEGSLVDPMRVVAPIHAGEAEEVEKGGNEVPTESKEEENGLISLSEHLMKMVEPSSDMAQQRSSPHPLDDNASVASIESLSQTVKNQNLMNAQAPLKNGHSGASANDILSGSVENDYKNNMKNVTKKLAKTSVASRNKPNKLFPKKALSATTATATATATTAQTANTSAIDKKKSLNPVVIEKNQTKGSTEVVSVPEEKKHVLSDKELALKEKERKKKYVYLWLSHPCFMIICASQTHSWGRH
jgi:hypothetical protein